MARSSENMRAGGEAESVDASSLHLLVYSYLLHNNLGRTAKAFARTCGLATSGRLTSSDTPEYLSKLFNTVEDEVEEEEEEEEGGDDDDDADMSEVATTDVSTFKDDGRQQPNGTSAGKPIPRASDKRAIGKRASISDMATDSSPLSLRGSLASSGSGGAGRKDSGVIGDNTCHGALSTASQRPTQQSAETERANELIDHHIEYLHIRQSICSSIEAGEPEVALDLLSTYFRTVLIPPPSESLVVGSLPLRREFNATLLRFRLDTQYYVELVANHQELDALIFGQRTLWRYPDIFDTWLNNSLGFGLHAPFQQQQQQQSQQQQNSNSQATGTAVYQQFQPAAGALSGDRSTKSKSQTQKAQQQQQQQSQQKQGHAGKGTIAYSSSLDDEIVSREELKQQRAEIMQHITNVAALVAYPDPHKSPLAELLSQDRRRELAISVNTAILQSMHFPREPALVTLVRQLAATSAYLVGYRSSSSRGSTVASTVASNADGSADSRVPWVLDTFINSDIDTDYHA